MVTATVGVDCRGRIVIPVEIRKQVGLEPGQQVVVLAVDDVILVKPIPKNLAEALYGCLKDGSSLTEMLSREHAAELARDAERGA